MKIRLPLILAALLAVSALLLVNSQYQARKLFMALEFAQSQTRQLEIEWSQLQLKQSQLSKHARIEDCLLYTSTLHPNVFYKVQYHYWK